MNHSVALHKGGPPINPNPQDMIELGVNNLGERFTCDLLTCAI